MSAPGTGLFVRPRTGRAPVLAPLVDLLASRALDSVYLDATALPLDAVPATIEAVLQASLVRPAAEITAALGKVRPEGVDGNRLRTAGATRVALSFVPPSGLVQRLRRAGLEVAVDLHPPQHDLATAERLRDAGARHLSIEGTSHAAAERLARAVETLGFARYDLWNLAVPGYECRHIVDARRGGELLATGPEAAGRVLVGGAWVDLRSDRRRLADPLAFAVERVVDGLQLAEGVEIERIAASLGVSPTSLLDADAAERFVALGWLVRDGDRTRLHPDSRAQTDPILVDLLGPALQTLARAGRSLQ